MSFNFTQDQPEGTLRGFRALLGMPRPIKLPFNLMRALSVVGLIAVLAAISADAGIYNASNPQPKDMQADKAPWPVYGTNLAVLMVLFYFAMRIFLAYAPAQFYDDTTKEPEDLPKAGSVVWFLYVTSLPALVTSLILYCTYTKDLTTFRASQLGMYITAMVCMGINFLLSNTPLLLRHGAAYLALVTAYMVFLFLYEGISGIQVYPFTSVVQPFLVIVFSGLMYVLLHGLWLAREGVLVYFTGRDSVIWYQPPTAEDIKNLESILANTGV